MKYLSIVLLALLVSCGGGSGGDNKVITVPPAPPTGDTDITPPTTTSPPPPPPPVIEVDLVKDNGDRFDPVVVDITSEAEYTYSVTMGRVVPTETGISIYGDGQTGTGILVINDDDEYQFEIVKEPVCLSDDALIDCVGHQVKTNYPDEGYIYYGDDDTRMVEWEIAYFRFDPYCTTTEEGSAIGECPDPEPSESERRRILENIDRMNEALSASKIYVRLVPVALKMAYFEFGKTGTIGEELDTDIILYADGASGGNGTTCGYAGFSSSFSRPLQPYSACGWKIHLHEIGHAVGLAHGPDNDEFPARGYIFPHFGHGSYSVCPGHDDIMSYGSRSLFSNSLLTCGEILGNSETQMAGLRGPGGTDTSYSINRVRYNVALINN